MLPELHMGFFPSRLTGAEALRWWRVVLLCWLGLSSITAPAAENTYRFDGVDRVVAVGDSHGAYDRFAALLRETGLVNEQMRWSGGKSQLVNLGDFLDRGPDSRKIMDLLMRLQNQAPKSGGKVHVLLGNHELMNLVGDLRYVSREEYLSYLDLEDPVRRKAARDYFDSLPDEMHSLSFDDIYPPGYFGHRQAMSPDGKYGKWLRTLPFMIVINQTAFVHGGLPGFVAERGLEDGNRELVQDLASYDHLWGQIREDVGEILPVTFRQRPRLADSSTLPVVDQFKELYWKPLFSPEGPVWAREDCVCLEVAVEPDLEAALEKLGASRVVLGHSVTFHHRIATRMDGRVIMIDTGMLDSVYSGGVASALVMEKGIASATYLGRGAGHEILPLPRHVGVRPGEMGDDELEEFLLTAPVVHIETLGSGITRPKRVTLERDGVRVRGIFKDVSHTEQRMGNTVIEFADHWMNEVAAYRVDRIMGLGAVPVTVEREVDDRHGSLQFWVDGLTNWRKVTEQGREPGTWCPMEPQYRVLRVFDALISNLDRTQENLTFEKDSWQLVLIDHSRSFSAKSRILEKLKTEHLVVSPAMARHLKRLDKEKLEAELGSFLSRSQVRGLLNRRDILLRDYAEQ
jgi:hypothetical protein